MSLQALAVEQLHFSLEMNTTLTPLTAQLRGNDFGRYKLIKRLAFGGMAEVYLAQLSGAASFSKLVVVKLVLPHCAEDPDFLELFRDEGRLAARLSHPNIAQTFEMGEASGRLFIAMEYVPGETIHSILRKAKDAQKPVPLKFALHVVLQLLSALHYAHSLKDEFGSPQYVVHRDVSPTNVMVTYEGTVKLVDFGIARAVSQQHRTGLGFLKGKPAYMAPEQQATGPIDRRADVFAAGTLVYELTTGRRAFDQATPLQIMQAVQLGRFETPQAVSPNFPADLQRIILKAMARVPDQRYQTAQAFRDELGTFASSIGMGPQEAEFGDYMRDIFKQQAPRELAEANRVALSPGAPPGSEQDNAEEVGSNDILTYAMPPHPELLELARGEGSKATQTDGASLFAAALKRELKMRALKIRSAMGWRMLGWGSILLVWLTGALLLEMRSEPSAAAARSPSAPATQGSPTDSVSSIVPEMGAELEPMEPQRKNPREVTVAPRLMRRPPLREQRTAKEVTEVPTTGRLKLDSTPIARVTEGGRLLGTTPLEIELPAGEHRFQLEVESLQKKRQLTLMIVGGEVTRDLENF